MWHSPKNSISETEIKREHLRILEEAVKDCCHYDIRTASVYESLDFFYEKLGKKWGVTVFRQGLEEWNPSALKEGLRLIKANF